MAFNVNSFKSNLNKGVARAAHYELDIGDSNILFRAVAVTAPGRSVATTPTNEFGPVREVVHSPIYTPITATIILSPDHQERQVLTEWQDKAIGINKGFYVGYYNEYIDQKVVKIKQYEETGSLKKTITLIEAYPRTIGEISYSYTATEYATFNVTFQYRFYIEG